jgi:hypothetical protein
MGLFRGLKVLLLRLRNDESKGNRRSFDFAQDDTLSHVSNSRPFDCAQGRLRGTPWFVPIGTTWCGFRFETDWEDLGVLGRVGCVLDHTLVSRRRGVRGGKPGVWRSVGK